MPKRSAPPIEEVIELPETEFEAVQFDDTPGWPRRAAWYWRLLGGGLVLAVLLAISFELAYWNKVYPGVSANGADLGGLSHRASEIRLADRITAFSGQTLPITYGGTTLRIPVHDLDTTYETSKVTDQAYQYGRRGSWWQRVREQARALLGRPTVFTSYDYSYTKLTPYILQVADDVATPAEDAALKYNDDRTQVTPASNGKRLNLGRLAQLVEDRLARTDNTAIKAPVYAMEPRVTTSALDLIAGQSDTYLSGPITLTYNDVIKEIPRSVITGWLRVDRQPERTFLGSRDINALYPPPAGLTLDLNREAIKAYVDDLAGRIDQEPRNASLVINNGQLSVSTPSQTGIALDRPGTINDIIAALAKPASNRKLALDLKTTKPDVREDKLAELGIKELLAEGVTYFPGSTKARLTNIRTGAARFNNVLLKPGETFSFGALLGDVGPETGYEPELVILANHEEKQYGGGLCQVSSTAFRAALLAGLPILERHNHSFAVSYYTAPYGVPGVDATIYYPQLDFKFKNDTPGYILIQTIMQGTTLKFEYYGTKTKSGVIRGPQFISGSTDSTQPSHTIFYRDVLDMDGKVTKTDTFQTYYKSSADFPIQQQFN